MNTKPLTTQKKIWPVAAIGFALLFLVAAPRTAQAQWGTSGNDISNTNSGNVGIGTSTPAHRLDVLVNAQWVARFKKSDSTNGGIIIDAAASYNPNVALAVNGTNKWFMHSNSGSSDAFQFLDSGGTARFTLTQGGNVGIGTSSPKSRIDLKQASDDFVGGLHLRRSTTNDTWSLVTGEDNNLYMGYATNASAADAAADFTIYPLVLTATNRVGIGTASPGTKVDISLANNDFLRIIESGSATPNRVFLGDLTNAGYLDLRGSDGNVRTLLNAGQTSYINSSGGNVGIGTSTPSYKLDVAGEIRSSTGGFRFPDGTVQTTAASGGGGSSQWTTSGSNIYYNSGNIGIGTSAPSRQLHLHSAANTVFQITDGTSGATSNDGFQLIQAGLSTYFENQEAGSMIFRTSATDRMTITSTGNVGIGTTSILAHYPSLTALQLGGNATWFGATTRGAGNSWNLSLNAYYDASGWKYISTDKASNYQQYNGGHLWEVAASGTAGNAITFTDAMAIDSTGKIGIGTTSPVARLQVAGSIYSSSAQTNTVFSGAVAASNANYAGSEGYWALRTATNNSYNLDVYNSGTPITATTVLQSGNVGIGTTTPGSKLEVAGEVRSTSGGFKFPDGTVQTTAASGGGGGGTITGVTAGTGLTGGGSSGTVTVTNNDKGSDQFIFKNVANASGTTQFSAASNSDAVRFAGTGGTNVTFDVGTKKVTFDSSSITSSQWTTTGSNINYTSGNVGIGIAPTEKLHVSGNGKITGNLTVDGNIAAKYQDVAEWVPTSEPLATATVVVLDSNKSNQVIASSQAYDTRVAGVISEQPGIALGESGAGKVLVATTGRVLVQVDASRSAIHIGDLLVTSDVPGVAMKSEPIQLGGRSMHMPGTIIGKALEPLEKGSGKILVLLSLQ